MTFLRNGWPIILVFLLFIVSERLKLIAHEDFYVVLVATLIGVFLAFWFNSLFLFALKKSENKEKLIQLLEFLESELSLNDYRIKHFKKAVSDAVTLNIFFEALPGITELSKGLRSDSYYAMQSSGYFEVLKDRELTNKIINVYQKIGTLQYGIKFFWTTVVENPVKMKKEEEEKAKARDELYPKIIENCNELNNLLDELLKMLNKKNRNLIK